MLGCLRQANWQGTHAAWSGTHACHFLAIAATCDESAAQIRASWSVGEVTYGELKSCHKDWLPACDNFACLMPGCCLAACGPAALNA